MTKTISIVFPVYNEENNIKGLVERSFIELNKMPYEYEILIVNNASTDNTKTIIEGLAQKHPQVRVIHHPSNLGYAMSTRTGFKNSKGDIIFVIDGDGQHTVNDIPVFIEKIESGYDIIFGWKKQRNDPFMRIVMTRVLNLLARWILHYPFHDINCGYRAVTKEVAQKIEIEHRLNAVGPEIYTWGVLHGYKMAEVCVQHFPRESGQSVHSLWTIPLSVIKMIRYLLKLRRQLLENRKR
ncbi:MAG: hypothetical protein Fur0020_13990 [Thermodesulfovibrionia bacterium]